MEFAPLLLFVVPCWLIGCVFSRIFCPTEVRFCFTHADRSAGFELAKGSLSTEYHAGKRGENWSRESFVRARLLLLILGRFLCCVEGLFCKTRAGSR